MACRFLGPLIVWLIKKDQSPFVDDQAKEALNFQIAVTIATWVSSRSFGCFALESCCCRLLESDRLCFPSLPPIEANKGVYYRYPYTLRLVP